MRVLPHAELERRLLEGVLCLTAQAQVHGVRPAWEQRDGVHERAEPVFVGVLTGEDKVDLRSIRAAVFAVAIHREHGGIATAGKHLDLGCVGAKLIDKEVSLRAVAGEDELEAPHVVHDDLTRGLVVEELMQTDAVVERRNGNTRCMVEHDRGHEREMRADDDIGPEAADNRIKALAKKLLERSTDVCHLFGLVDGGHGSLVEGIDNAERQSGGLDLHREELDAVDRRRRIPRLDPAGNADLRPSPNVGGELALKTCHTVGQRRLHSRHV